MQETSRNQSGEEEEGFIEKGENYRVAYEKLTSTDGWEEIINYRSNNQVHLTGGRG